VKCSWSASHCARRTQNNNNNNNNNNNSNSASDRNLHIERRGALAVGGERVRTRLG
jgi:hypothetical protein